MRKRKIGRGRRKTHPILYVVASCLAVTLLVKIFFLPFSDEIGQARASVIKIALSNIYEQVMEEGASLFKYKANGEPEKKTVVENLMENQIVVHRYMKEENKGSSNSFYPSENLWNDNTIVIPQEENVPVEEEDNQSFIGIYQMPGEMATEYILSNGAAFNESTLKDYYAKEGIYEELTGNELAVGVLDGDIEVRESSDNNNIGEGSALETFNSRTKINYTMEQLKNVTFLINTFYIVDTNTKIPSGLFDAETMLAKNMKIKQDNSKPQILIYHTHSEEAFADSKPGDPSESIVGVGEYLTEILEKQYGYNVIHDRSVYDVQNGLLDRDKAYNYALKGITKILDENPSIEVVIDLHRDGAKKRSILLDGKETAQIMLFNGLSYDLDGKIEYLDNPNLKDNLAFSLQLQLKANDRYPGLFYRNYLKSYRYNLHVRPKSILVELGTHKNTLASAKNAMEPFAEILNEVLQGDKIEPASN